MPKSETKTCPTCNGNGTVRVRYTDPDVTCGECGGAGVVPVEGAVLAEEASKVVKPKDVA